jgi:type III secretory pathway component EscU
MKILLSLLFISSFLFSNELLNFEKELINKKFNNKKIFSTRYSIVNKQLKIIWILNNINILNKDINKNNLKDILFNLNKKNICIKKYLKEFNKNNRSIKYIYFDKNNKYITSIIFNKKTCLE